MLIETIISILVIANVIGIVIAFLGIITGCERLFYLGFGTMFITIVSFIVLAVICMFIGACSTIANFIS